MLRKTYPLILSLIFVALVMAGCRVRSAGERKEPTPRNNVVINYNIQQNQTPDAGLDDFTLTPSPTLTILSPTPTEDEATPTMEGFVSETPTPTATETLSEFTGVGVFTDTPTMMLPPSLTPTPTETFFVSPTTPPTATFTDTPSPTPTATATNTDLPTATNTPSPSITPTSTPTSRFTLTFTPFPPPTITPLGFSSNGGIGGGSNAVANTPTPPLAIVQDGPTQNPQQQTATAYILQATLTIQALQGTFFPTPTFETFDGTGGQFIPSATPTVLYPDCQEFIDPGETLSQIARTYSMDIAVIAAANNITNYDFIKAGDYLIIPGCGRIPSPTPTPTAFTGDGSGGGISGPPAELDNSQGPVTYTVVAGDTLYKLSIQFNVTLAQLWSANPMVTNINVLTIGQRLTIPKRTLFDTPTPTPTFTG